MGIHIIPYILGERKTEEGWGSKTMYFEKQEYNNFDSIRKIGDSDFVFSENIEWEFIFDNPDVKDYENSYRRPKDIDLAIEWIGKNIIDDRDRLVKLMNDMKENKNLWITISY